MEVRRGGAPASLPRTGAEGQAGGILLAGAAYRRKDLAKRSDGLKFAAQVYAQRKDLAFHAASVRDQRKLLGVLPGVGRGAARARRGTK